LLSHKIKHKFIQYLFFLLIFADIFNNNVYLFIIQFLFVLLNIKININDMFLILYLLFFSNNYTVIIIFLLLMYCVKNYKIMNFFCQYFDYCIKKMKNRILE
jgi:hypothetical protein